MTRWMSTVFALCAAIGCESVSKPSQTEAPMQVSSPEAFAGVWRSVTPSLEFIRLSVYSKSSEMGVLAARLTFSGVAWEGGGRIEGDSLVTSMAIVGAAAPTGVMVAHARDAQTLRVRMRPPAGAALDLTFVRED